MLHMNLPGVRINRKADTHVADLFSNGDGQFLGRYRGNGHHQD